MNRDTKVSPILRIGNHPEGPQNLEWGRRFRLPSSNEHDETMTADKSANFLSKACAAPVPGSFCKTAARQASSLRNRPATRPRLTPTTIGVVGSNRPSTSRCAPTSVHRCLPPASAGSFCKSTDTTLSPLRGSFCKRAERRPHSFPDGRLTHAATTTSRQIGFVYANALSAPDHIQDPFPASFCKPIPRPRFPHPAGSSLIGAHLIRYNGQSARFRYT